MLEVTPKVKWKIVRFDQMAEMANDRIDNPSEANVDRYVGLEHLDSDSLRIRRWGSPSDVEATKLLFRNGDIIFGRRRAYQRKLAVADFDGICSAHAMVLRARPEVALPEFLPFFMQSHLFMERAKEISVGSLSPTINWKTLAKQKFALPPPEEQRRISELLQQIERTTESLQRLEDQIHLTYSSLLDRVFSNAKEPAPELGKTKAADGTLWEWHRVDELFSVQLGKMSSKKSREGGNQAEYIKNNNVLWGSFVLENLPQMSFDEREREKFALKPGDLLVCEGGEIGRAAIWERADGNVYYQKALHRLRPLNVGTSTVFFMHYLRACAEFGILNRIATGSTILHLPRERLAELRLPFPGHEEQDRYATLFERSLAAIRDTRERQKRTEGLKKQILTKMST